MWCDDFDMDLPKIMPGAMDMIARVAPIPLYTTGNKGKDGRLDHPSCWNTDFGFEAFFRFCPEHPMPAGFCDGGRPVVECTFSEAIRDAWIHDYAIGLLWPRALRGKMQHQVIWDGMRYMPYFQVIMGHIRGWHPATEEELATARRIVVWSLSSATTLLETCLKDWGGQ
jgi:hypothetical protein